MVFCLPLVGVVSFGESSEEKKWLVDLGESAGRASSAIVLSYGRTVPAAVGVVVFLGLRPGDARRNVLVPAGDVLFSCCRRYFCFR